MSEQENKKKTSYVGWILFIFIILVLTLPFHWSADYGTVFPKEHLTFSYTYFTNEDVSKIIERHNNANFFERQAISREPFVRKLMEKGIIIDEAEQEKRRNYNDSIQRVEHERRIELQKLENERIKKRELENFAKNFANEVYVVDSTSGFFSCKLLEFSSIKNQQLLKEIYDMTGLEFTDYSQKGLLQAINNYKLSLTKHEDEFIKEHMKYFGSTGLEDCISLNVFSTDENFITIEYDYMGSRGGVGHLDNKYVTFDKNNEQVIKLSDVLKSTENTTEWNRILRKYVKTRNDCVEDPIPISEFFYCDTQSITFVYGKYKIACGADGVVHITVPFSEIRSYLKYEFIDKYL